MLRVATWNLENLFPPGTEGGPTSEQVYLQKLESLAGTILEIQPDILAVQEVGRQEALNDLTERLDGHWHTITSEHPDGRGIRVGFLSTISFSEIEQVFELCQPLAPIQQDDSEQREHTMGRGALRVRIWHEDTDIDLVTCHLKSKLLSFPGTDGKTHFDTSDENLRARYGAYALFRRAAEAATVRAYADRLIDSQGERRCVVVLGDMNDVSSAATTQILFGPPGSQLDTPKAFQHSDKGDKMRLFNLAPLIPESERYSRTFEGHKELIDHILVSRCLADLKTDVSVHHQADESIGTNPSARRDIPGSDHDPVVATLRATPNS